jgi:hypothetical protein
MSPSVPVPSADAGGVTAWAKRRVVAAAVIINNDNNDKAAKGGVCLRAWIWSFMVFGNGKGGQKETKGTKNTFYIMVFLAVFVFFCSKQLFDF